mmetsp:Transcript_25097/g.28051  ORF Transcript_25097/g.28051 Transcript_25097/m.28051 type:complete len:658 (+) Transcript_25097:125-2098(+)
MKFYSVSLSLWAATATVAVASTGFHAATAVKIDSAILLHRSLQEEDNNTTDTDTAEITDCRSILDSYADDNNTTCVDASPIDDRDGNATLFIGNSVTSDYGNTVESYRGIKYATLKRFAPSEILLADGVIDATTYGDACPQRPTNPFFNGSFSLIEDCLYLNIWKPSSENDDVLLPVMVYIHGGGFVGGHGSNPGFDGTNLAGTEDIVVVTLNYRLGVFGSLITDEEGTGGMNGILDQIKALEWVQQYISFFGGDPNRTTIFGNSAGAQSVGMLSVVPQANGLFKRAIMQSGNIYIIGIDDGMQAVTDMLNQTEICSMAPCTIEDLYNLTTDELLTVSNNGSFVWKAIYDNAVLPVNAATLYSKGPINPTDMIIGANTYDYAEIWDDDVMETADAVIPQMHGDRGDAYSPDKYNDSSLGAYAQFFGDSQFNCPSRQFAEIASSSIDGNIYNYLFGYLSDYDYAKLYLNVTDPTWTSHIADAVYVFGNPAAQPFSNSEKPFSEKDKILNKEIMSRWANFARSGNPFASSSEEEWLPVVPDSDNSPDIYAGAGVDPRYLYITGDGGTMIQSNKDKMEQCASHAADNPAPFESKDDADADSDKINNNNYDNTTTNGNSLVPDVTVNATTSSSGSKRGGTVNNIVLAGWLVIVVLFGCMMI